MVGPLKPQRIRDPLHNLIEFDTGQFERTLWQVIQTLPFQRLRRIRQLGFSELVYPGATHTRFAHSIGVFHTARRLMRIIESHLGKQFRHHQAQVAVAAALVHDVGHGMFSHAFEDIGETLRLPMAHHEAVSDRLIRDSEISEAFGKEFGSGFATDVAEVIKRGPGNLYDAIVSSQFDADRLDYMQRDRLMTGVRNSAIDFDWLMANLEVGTVTHGVDENPLKEIETFVVGPKALHAAETYVLALFQLYPNVYFHKTTRAAEKVFSRLMLRIIRLARDGFGAKTGLPDVHPIIRFAREPESLERAQALDDTVFWGALSMLADAEDPSIKENALRLTERRLPKCIDIRDALKATMPMDRAKPVAKEKRDKVEKRLARAVLSIGVRLQEWCDENSNGTPRILIDRATRDPYKRVQESKGPLNQLRIRAAGGGILDMAESSPVVAGIEKFELFRAYYGEQDVEAKNVVESIIKEEGGRRSHGDS